MVKRSLSNLFPLLMNACPPHSHDAISALERMFILISRAFIMAKSIGLILEEYGQRVDYTGRIEAKPTVHDMTRMKT